jgi:hypothetical protein
MKPQSSLITAPLVKQDYVGEQIEKFRGNLVVYNEKKKIMIPYHANIIDNQEKGELALSFPGYQIIDYKNKTTT